MNPSESNRPYDYVIVGSGFGGSISAMRLAEKGYRVLMLERGRRFADEQLPRTDWDLRKHQWIPALRCFGIWQNTLLNGIMILHGAGVGGGSLVYANVLMEPDDRLFAAPAWRHLADWKRVLQPYYAMAGRMLGVTDVPRPWAADHLLKRAAAALGREPTFRPTRVGVFFNEENPGEWVPDPYFGGAGPRRKGCTHCGACMVGCRDDAKNTLDKNYLYFAEKWGARVQPEATVTDIRPRNADPKAEARYAVHYRRTTARSGGRGGVVLAHNVIVSAGAVNTNRLLLRLRDVVGSLPGLSRRLGTLVRTNSESLTSVTVRHNREDFSKGVAIGSIFRADAQTQIEVVRFPDRSGVLLKLLAAPLIDGAGGVPERLLETIRRTVLQPDDFLHTKLRAGIATRTAVLLTMQTVDNLMRVRLGRNLFTRFRKDLVCEADEMRPIPSMVAIAHRTTRLMAHAVDGIAQGMVNESLLNIPGTAHFMGGVPFGRTAADGVIGLNAEVHGYPGLFVVDGSIMPANPGVNPTLTICALAEYVMDQIPPKPGTPVRKPMMAS